MGRELEDTDQAPCSHTKVLHANGCRSVGSEKESLPGCRPEKQFNSDVLTSLLWRRIRVKQLGRSGDGLDGGGRTGDDHGTCRWVLTCP